MRGQACRSARHRASRRAERDLLRDGSLTAEEYGAIRYHTARGEAVRAASLRGGIARAVIRHDHGWFDGTGYPDRLARRGNAFEARVAAVADGYDALRSDARIAPGARPRRPTN